MIIIEKLDFVKHIQQRYRKINGNPMQSYKSANAILEKEIIVISVCIRLKCREES